MTRPQPADTVNYARRGLLWPPERRINKYFRRDGVMPKVYSVRVKEHLDQRWSDWFDGLTLTQHADGTTVLTGAVADQAALHGIIAKIRDLGLTLISVTPRDPE